jgi:glycosyltransferase involved in cell wall biosynthesis
MIKVALLTTDSREHFKDYLNPNPYFGTAPEALIEGFKLLPEKVEIHIISCLQKAPVSSPTKLAENIYYHALHVPNIGWMKTGYQGCIRAVRRKLQEIHPDIVHGQGTERDCAMCAVFSGFANVLTIHGVMRSIYKISQQKPLGYYWFAKHLERIALKLTNGLICISPYVCDLLSRDVVRSWIIPNALRQEFFWNVPNNQRLPGVPRLLNVGVISPRKRQLELLTLLADLRRNVSFSATFVGRASKTNSYARQFLRVVEELNNQFGGFSHVEEADNQTILRLYDESDAMVHFASEESYGLTFAEALVRNIPLFASDVGAIRQIGDGIAECKIFAPDDFTGLINSFRLWIEANTWTAARETLPNRLIAARYHPRVIAEKHIEVYREVADHTS